MARFPTWSALTILLISALNFSLVHGRVAAVPGALIFARANEGCAQNCPETAPVCNCKEDERCELVAQTCTECAMVLCKPSSRSKSGPSGGAIAGACIGGLVGAGILGVVVYRSCLKKRSNRMSMGVTAAEKENDFGMLKSARASTHTVASIASTVRTRASNVIQIAYIPGVTNRSSPSTPAHLVPPVPPLPYSDSPVGSQFPRPPNMDIQFAADDLLRGSMCTTDNRSSIATTIYGGNAVVQQPNIIRAGKAAVVTVKGGSSAGTSSTGSPNPESPESVPPIPALFTAAGGPSARGAAPSSPAFSVGATFLDRVNTKGGSDTDTTPEPQRRAVPGRSQLAHENHSTASFMSDGSSIVPGHRGNVVPSQSTSAISSCITDMDAGSPFSDANSMSIDAIPLANDSRRLSAVNAAGTGGPLRLVDVSKPAERTVSPFDDLHSVDSSKSR